MLTANVLGPLAGWDAAAATYVTWAWILMSGADAEQTARLAVREDPGRAVVDVILLSASVASIVAVAAVIIAGGSHSTVDPILAAAFGASSLLLTWVLIHTVFTTRYARLYYTGTDGGIDFNQEQPPSYLDFAYLAFTIGMTYQVSDTDLKTPAIRHTALRHGLLSYLFGAIIIAATINLLSGLAK
ncbi:DUF1345 domain-containing protein [Actinoplanes subtropicus]|uniref:DUF1345 domain-containing protein n=1 Tax=Actinoplanes subtropicus TaxID=543632 RepID=UPI000A3E5AD3|nr:DUF1345 domain-containing protein [Actinoplanes subtropicus]